MYVKRVTLKNVKCLSDFTLEFPDPPTGERSGGWYVIVGPNGFGKTTMLKAIAWAVEGGKWFSWAPWTAGLRRARGVQERVWIEGWFRDGRPACPGGDRYSIALMPGPAYRDTGTQANWDWLGPEHPLERHFVAGYGAFRREGGRTGLGQRPFWAARFNSLFEDDFALDSTRWLVEAEARARLDEAEAAHPYETVVAEVPSLLQPVIPFGFAMLPLSPDGVRFRHLLGKGVGLAELGDGYRSIVGLVLRLLRDLLRWRAGDEESGAFGSLGTDGASANEAAQTPGVVLIDEPDAHLHPSWQREIGFALQRVFPNIQFIVATHSPFICQAASPGGIFQLRMNEAERRIEAVQPVEDTVRGWHIQDIYREALGLDNWLDVTTAADLERYQQLAAAQRAGPLPPQDAARLADLGANLRDVLTAPGQTPEAREEYRRLRKLRERLEAKVEGGGS